MNSDSLKRRLWLALPVVFGLLCAAARRWQLSTGFEGGLKLPIPFAPASVVLVILLIIGGLALLLLALRQPCSPALLDERGVTPFAGDDKVFLVGAVVAAFLTLTAAPVLFQRGRQLWSTYQLAKLHNVTVPGGNNGVLTLLTAITALLAFFGLLLGGKAIYRRTRQNGMVLLLPVVNSCLWLMEVYRGHAADPVRWDYAPLLLAIVSGLLFYLDWAGLFAGAVHPRRTLWLAGMTVVLSAAALAGQWEWQDVLLLLSQLVSALAVLWHMPQYVEYPPEPAAAPAQTEEKPEDDTHE